MRESFDRPRMIGGRYGAWRDENVGLRLGPDGGNFTTSWTTGRTSLVTVKTLNGNNRVLI